MPAYRLDIAYDGTDFHGYATQPSVRTVQGVLEEALFRITGPVSTSVAGRTDAGVHAAHQVVSFRTEEILDVARLAASLNRTLPDDVSVLDAGEVAPDFDARFSARARTYRYMVLNRSSPDPLLRRTSWHVPTPLDVDAMNEAASGFLGEHDFASFCRRAPGRSTVRHVLAARWVRPDEAIARFEITATSYCHQMVRSLVALCVDVGRGRVTPADVSGILDARDRNAARGAAPPWGLVLWSVDY